MIWKKQFFFGKMRKKHLTHWKFYCVLNLKKFQISVEKILLVLETASSAYMVYIFMMTIAGMAIIATIGVYWAEPLHSSVSQVSQISPVSPPPICWHTTLVAFAAHPRKRWPVAKKNFFICKTIKFKWKQKKTRTLLVNEF